MAVSTNLALRPFRNERVPWLLTGLLLVLAVAVSVVHTQFLSRLLSGGDAKAVGAVLEDEARIAALEQSLMSEPPLKLEPAELARLRAFKGLVDRRVFPWRYLLSELEGLLADNVRLTAISPTTVKGASGMVISLSGEARTKEAAFSLAEALGAAPSFTNATLNSLTEREGAVEFDLEVIFFPEGRGDAGPLVADRARASPHAPGERPGGETP